MAQQINATMSTSIALDLVKASESVKNLTSLVRSSQSAWKTQEAEMKSAGDAVGAAQVKYEGLGKSIEAQQSKIDALKSKQSELKGNTTETAQQFLKYQQQIDGATKQLASMQAQQDRAKQAMDYQKSGLAGLQSEYTAAARANQAYVTRLQAEGKQQEANKAQMDGYKSSVANLNEQLSKQSAELDKIASASGKDSDAWRTQKTRVDETATSLAKAKSSMTGLQAEMDKANPSVWDKIKTHITGTKKETDKATFSFKKMVGATAIGQAISNGWTQFSGTIKSTISQGLQLAEAGEQATRVWETLGVSDKGANQLVAQMRQLKSETNLSADQVATLQKRFYGMTGSVQKTQDLTTGVATLADKLRLSGDGASAFAKSMQRAMNSGKLTTGVLTRMENAAPGLGSALAKASGVSETAFNSMVAGGQISSKKLQDLIVKISKDSKSTFNDFGNTAEGATQRLKGAWQGVEATLAKPLVSVQSTGISSIVNVLQSSAVTKLFSSLGTAIAGAAKQAANMLDYVAKHQKDVGGIITSLGTIVKIFAGTVWHTIAGVVSSIAKSFGLMGSGAGKAADPLKNANTALGNIAKNKSGIQTTAKVMLAMWAAMKIGKVAITGLSTAVDIYAKRADIMAVSQKALNLVVKASPWIALATVIIAVGVALVNLYKHNAKFKAFVDGIVKSVQNMAKGIGKWFGQLPKNFNNAMKSVGKGWNSFLKTMSSWGKSIALTWNKIWTPITKGMSAVWNGVVKATKAGLNVLKLAIVIPIALIVGLAVKAWQKIEKPFMTVWNGIAKFIKPILNGIGKFITGTAKDVSNVWNKYWQFVAKFFTGIWNTIVKVGTTAFNTVSKGISSFLSAVNKVWTDSWNAISKFFSSIWNDMVKFFTPIINGISSTISNVVNAIKKTWDTVWGAISKFFGDTWNGMVRFYSPIIHGISSTIGSVINAIKSVWKDVWGDVGSFFGGIWDGIKKAAESGINFVVRVIRAGLSAVNDVLGFFGVNKVDLPSYVHFAQGGEVGKDGTQLAMVNDDGSEHYKELIHKKRTGQWLYTDKKNAILPLETGDRVYNGKESKAIADMYGIPGFAQGGIIGSVWDGVKNASSWVADKAGDVGKWIGDKVTAITDWIAHPIKHVTALIEKAISSLVNSAPVKAFGQLGEGIFKHAYNGIADWIKKHLETVQKSMEASSVAGQPKQAQAWLPVVERLMKQMGANPPSGIASEAAAFVREIARESGGNASIRQQIVDVNSLNGNPAEGLLQFIPSTFMAYAVPGHTNILNGEDQIMATINAYMHSGAWDRIGTGEQINFLANGATVNRPLSAIIGEDGPETVLPLGAAKASRAWQLLGQAVSNINQNLGASSSNNAQSDSDVGSKLDAIISLLTLAVESGQSDSTSGMSSNRFADQLAKMLAPKMQQQLTNQKLRGGVII
ncbi:tape measure protein [Schleiferilactobacillus harbinensis]|uniref:tape measure protein n=1 Tax=Schleiferilactobacillus harbinensis TaxID=304207 RepID=UPI001CC29C6A|nr:tape measure protein [Schleiferilactobacillus harbinensis]